MDNEPIQWLDLGYVTLPLDQNPCGDVYELKTDAKTKTARAIVNITAPLRMQIRYLEAVAKPIDDVMQAVQEGKES